MDTARCGQCGSVATVRERTVREGTHGPQEHARAACPQGHHLSMAVGTPAREEMVYRPRTRPMRIMLLCSGFNGLTQRAWVELREAGHDVVVQRAGDDHALVAALAATEPDLVICPFLRERVPARVWTRHRTIIIHPGPKGDRGPSSLDWAIMDGATAWGVTALQAVDAMDAGPIWAARVFPVTGQAPTKSGLYNGAVTEAALELVHEVVAKAADPSFLPEPLDYTRPDVCGRLRPAARQSDRAFRWSDNTEHVLRRIRAADGAPGVHTELCGLPVAVFDAHPGGLDPEDRGAPGTLAARRHGAVLVRTGDGAVWVGQLRLRADTAPSRLKLPATTVLDEHLEGVPEAADAAGCEAVRYRRRGALGVVDVRFYNGAMSTAQCRRLLSAMQHAVAQDTRVLLLRGGAPFANGIHLGVIEAAPDPAGEAWANIVAIDDVCQEIITCVDQLVVCSVAGNAGAGGVMLALGADHVLLRDGAVLNPHYRTMGLFGSEYWTYVLPRRVGEPTARALTERCLPVGATEALRIGLVDSVLPGDHTAFERAVEQRASHLAIADDYAVALAAKRRRRAADERRKPLQAYRRAELAEMRKDIFEARNDFAGARHRFLAKHPPGRARAATG